MTTKSTTDDTDESSEYTQEDIAADARTLRSDPASMDAAGALLTRLRANLADISPVSICFLATQRHPGRVVDALATLNEEFGELFANLAFISEKVEEAEAAERTRLAPLIAEAGRRVLDGTTRLENIPSEVAYVESIAGAARAKYETAGLSAAEITGLTKKLADENAQRAASLKEEQVRLATELDTLGAFLRTRDESALPDGFAPRSPVPVLSYRPAVSRG